MTAIVVMALRKDVADCYQLRDEGIYYVMRESRSIAIKLRPRSEGHDTELYRTNATPYWHSVRRSLWSTG